MLELTQDLLLKDVKTRAILVTGGKAPSLKFLKEVRKRFPKALWVCADHGADQVLAAGLMPDAVLGDMDSLSRPSRERLDKAQVDFHVFPVEKDVTDTQIALDYLFEEGVQEVILLGGFGSRLDHSLANVMLLAGYTRRGKSLVMMDEVNCMRYVDPGEYRVPQAQGFFSLVPLDSEGMTLSLEGFRYPLEETKVAFGKSRLVSNKWLPSCESGLVRIKSGYGLMCISCDHEEEEKYENLFSC